jgi:hypothetical protein
VNPEKVQYVVELLQKGAKYNGMKAEAIALRLLYALGHHLNGNNAWQTRLAQYVGDQKVVLRAFCTLKDRYLSHLRRIRDWDGHSEGEGVLSVLGSTLPQMLWIVEFSIPQLFPANERKIGEIVLDASCPSKDDADLFSIARLPGNYLTLTDKKKRSYERVPSQLQSHVELMRQND